MVLSADNGIYILDTPRREGIGREYRVAHLQAVQDVDWDGLHLLIRRLWRGAGVWFEKDEALIAAGDMYDEIMQDDFCPVVEYGIQFVRVEEVF